MKLPEDRSLVEAEAMRILSRPPAVDRAVTQTRGRIGDVLVSEDFHPVSPELRRHFFAGLKAFSPYGRNAPDVSPAEAPKIQENTARLDEWLKQCHKNGLIIIPGIEIDAIGGFVRRMDGLLQGDKKLLLEKRARGAIEFVEGLDRWRSGARSEEAARQLLLKREDWKALRELAALLHRKAA